MTQSSAEPPGREAPPVPPPATNTPARSPYRGLVVAVLIVATAVAGFVFARWLAYRLTHSITGDAFVESDMINLAPQVPGEIVQMFVQDNERAGVIFATAINTAHESLRLGVIPGLDPTGQLQRTLENHVRQRGSTPAEAAAQAAVVLDAWIHQNAQVMGYQTTLRWIALFSGAALVVSFGLPLVRFGRRS